MVVLVELIVFSRTSVWSTVGPVKIWGKLTGVFIGKVGIVAEYICQGALIRP